MLRKSRCLQVFWWFIVAVAIYVVVAGFSQSPVDFTKKALYVDSHNVVEVKAAPQLSFEVSQNPRIVVFYSPYCPHCIKFRDPFQTVARQTQEKHSKVEFYGVSCTLLGAVCRKYSIGKYPTIVSIQEGSPADSYTELGQFMFSVSKVEKALGL